MSGIEGLCEVAAFNKADMTLTSVVGNIGLLPTVEAIKNKKKILLANKETLVTGGDIVNARAKEKGIKIIPVDFYNFPDKKIQLENILYFAVFSNLLRILFIYFSL